MLFRSYQFQNLICYYQPGRYHERQTGIAINLATFGHFFVRMIELLVLWEKKESDSYLLWIFCNCSSNLHKDLKEKQTKCNNSAKKKLTIFLKLRKTFLDSHIIYQYVTPNFHSSRSNGVTRTKITNKHPAQIRNYLKKIAVIDNYNKYRAHKVQIACYFYSPYRSPHSLF